MKRIDLVPGVEVGYHRSNRWGTPERATVVDAGHWRPDPARGGHWVPAAENDKKSCVLVDLHRADGPPLRSAVHPQHLRGRWADYHAAWTARWREDLAKEADKADREAELRAQQKQIIERARAAGFQLRPVQWGNKGWVEMPLEVAEALLNAADA